MNEFNDSAFSSTSQGFGQLGQDRTLDYEVRYRHPKRQRELDFLIEFNNFAANIVELLPQAMGQKIAVFECADERTQKTIQKKIDKITPYFVRATTLARQCGGAGLFLGNSDEKLSEPLNTPVLFYNVLQGGREGVLKIKEIEKNALNPNYEKPKFYKLNHDGELIHHSRVIPFYGIKMITRDQQQRYQYWGASVLQRSLDKLKNLDIADQSIANTVDQFSRLVYEIENLMELLSSEKGKELLKERLKSLNHSWNVLKTLVVQKGEKVYTIETNYTGLDAVLAHFKEMLAGSADIPYQKLFNSGGGGGLSGASSASGSIDRTTERQWSDLVFSKQENEWLPELTRLVDHWLQTPTIYTLEFTNLLQLSETEEIANEKIKAETEKIKSEIITQKQVNDIE